MCTFIILQGVHPDLPVVVAATRDEFYARRTTGPQVLAPGIVGGRDEEKGGTWLGVTAGGLFVGLTNQRSGGRVDRTRRSRGEIVLAALRSGSPGGVRRLLAGLDGQAYNGFNLLFGDATGMAVAYGRPGERDIAVDTISDGLHVLPNDRLDADDWPKVHRARDLVAPQLGAPWPAMSRWLGRVLGDHVRPPLDQVPPPPPDSPLSRELIRELGALCIHTEVYGTRSGSISALVPNGVAHYLVADGPPCVTPFVDHTALLRRPPPP